MYKLLLVCCDTAQLADEISRNIEGSAFSLVVARGMEEMQGCLQTDTFDLTLLDIDMTHQYGVDVIKTELNSAGQPLVVVTKSPETDIILRSIALGADDFMLLPLSPVALQTRLQVSIQRRKFQQGKVHDLLEFSQQITRVLTPEPTQPGQHDLMVNIDAFLHRVLTEIKAMYNADAGTVYFREDDHLRFAVVQTDSMGVVLGGSSDTPVTFSPLHLYLDENKTPNYRNIATYVALKGEAINIPDIYETDKFDFTATKAFDTANHYKSISCLTIPLRDHRDKVIGVMQLLNACSSDGFIIPFDSHKQIITEALCAHVATILTNRLLIQQQVLMTKVEHDVQIARTIQQTFLPTKFPELPGWEVSSYFRPAREVAGDFYDVFTMPGNRLGLVIADVCDKGVGAALFMSLMRSLLRAYAMQPGTLDASKFLDTGAVSARRLRNLSAKKIMPSAGTLALENAIKQTNHYVAAYHGDLNMFATTFFGVLDPAKHSLVYINGGHCSPMILDKEGNIKTRLDTTGPAVGMFDDSEFDLGQVILDPGDSLFAFTDGVTDARNISGDMFKENGLTAMLQPSAPSIQGLLSRVSDKLDNFIGEAVQFDDITMLGLRYLGEPPQPAE